MKVSLYLLKALSVNYCNSWHFPVLKQKIEGNHNYSLFIKTGLWVYTDIIISWMWKMQAYLWSLMRLCYGAFGNILPGEIGSLFCTVWEELLYAASSMLFERPKGPSPGNVIVSICFWQNSELLLLPCTTTTPGHTSLSQCTRTNCTKEALPTPCIESTLMVETKTTTKFPCIVVCLRSFSSSQGQWLSMDWIGLLPQGFG